MVFHVHVSHWTPNTCISSLCQLYKYLHTSHKQSMNSKLTWYSAPNLRFLTLLTAMPCFVTEFLVCTESKYWTSFFTITFSQGNCYRSNRSTQTLQLRVSHYINICVIGNLQMECIYWYNVTSLSFLYSSLQSKFECVTSQFQ